MKLVCLSLPPGESIWTLKVVSLNYVPAKGERIQTLAVAETEAQLAEIWKRYSTAELTIEWGTPSTLVLEEGGPKWRDDVSFDELAERLESN